MAAMRRAGEKRLFCLLSHGLSSAITALWDLFVRKLPTGHSRYLPEASQVILLRKKIQMLFLSCRLRIVLSASSAVL
jgi:hypothetical protein